MKGQRSRGQRTEGRFSPQLPITDNRELVTRAQARSDNPRGTASVRGDYDDNRGNDDAKNPEEGVDAALEGSSVWIDFGRHGEGKIRNQKCFLTVNDAQRRIRFRCENPITPSANAAASHVLGSGTTVKLSRTGSGFPRPLEICT